MPTQSNMAGPAITRDRSGEAGRRARRPRRAIVAGSLTAAFACSLPLAPAVQAQGAADSIGELLEGKAAFGDWRSDAPLVRRKITELPPPFATRSAANPPRVVAKPAAAAPKVPPGFQVELFAANLRDPRVLRVAPNGDIFVAESEPGRIRVLRAAEGASQPDSNDVFASGLKDPFGIAFYPPGPDPHPPGPRPRPGGAAHSGACPAVGRPWTLTHNVAGAASRSRKAALPRSSRGLSPPLAIGANADQRPLPIGANGLAGGSHRS